jgi:hypothetical protein
LAVRSPCATGLASSLSGRFSFTGQRCPFRHRRHVGRFSRVLPGRRVLPGSNAPFVPPFGVFRLADLRFRRPPEPLVPCWFAVTTVCLSGQLRFTRRPKPPACYFTRLAAASHRCSSPGFLFAFPDCARTPSVEPVNPASLPRLASFGFEGPNQPAWFNLSPVARDYL